MLRGYSVTALAYVIRHDARVVKLVYTQRSERCGREAVRVRVPPRALPSSPAKAPLDGLQDREPHALTDRRLVV